MDYPSDNEKKEHILPKGIKVAASPETPYVDPFVMAETLMEARDAKRKAIKKERRARRKAKNDARQVLDKAFEWTVYEDNRWPPVPTWQSLKAYHEHDNNGRIK